MQTAARQTASSTIQPWLFDGMEQAAVSEVEKQAKFAINEMLRAKRNCTNAGFTHFVGEIEAAVKIIRAFSRLSDSQRRELILLAIEKQGATTVTEVSEDTRLAPALVKQLVELMITEGELYAVRKYIPGSDRQYYMLKSVRLRTPEVV